ncbi:hypothetical protein [Arenimonas oryziterrae]|uniref:hypothetical protein n=1 Tax=Arenimonas oryziterrae TaxID=498055 RepID=UPI0012DC8AAB|nr:hypothetical protein [Arenimonas oryziterrae]
MKQLAMGLGSLVLMLLQCACSSLVIEDLPVRSVAYVSVCRINEDPQEFENRIVNIRANYSVVKGYASFFEESSCERGGVLPEGYNTSADESVAAFDRAGDKLCEEHGKTGLCTLSAKVDIEGEVARDTEGTLMVNVRKVFSYSYLTIGGKKP